MHRAFGGGRQPSDFKVMQCPHEALSGSLSDTDMTMIQSYIILPSLLVIYTLNTLCSHGHWVVSWPEYFSTSWPPRGVMASSHL